MNITESRYAKLILTSLILAFGMDSATLTYGYSKMQDHKQEISSNTHEYEKSIDGADELVYHIDYNGPKTHPNPPDHP